jgi:hypothetical protein
MRLNVPLRIEDAYAAAYFYKRGQHSEGSWYLRGPQIRMKLGVFPSASEEEIDSAHRSKANEVRPDRPDGNATAMAARSEAMNQRRVIAPLSLSFKSRA